MIDPTIIKAGEQSITVQLMDESWIINRCAGAHPFKPRPGIVWNEADRCARLPEIPGTEFRAFFQQAMAEQGNCASIAWHAGRVLGHLVWLGRAKARQLRATGWPLFGPADEDAGTLVVINLAFCSLSGHEFRGKGVAKAMVAQMIAWAKDNGWRSIEVYDTPAGLFPWDWLDSCIPPKPFWEARGFTSFAHRAGSPSKKELAAMLADNPRNSDEEQAAKQQIAAAIRAGRIDESHMGSFDLRLSL